MADDIFAYHKHFEAVMREDIRFIKERELTYKSSWKKTPEAVWAMLVRKIDRLKNIMETPPSPANLNPNDVLQTIHQLTLNKRGDVFPLTAAFLNEVEFYIESYLRRDIFSKIEQEEKLSGGKGVDSSVLAECRDLRRYLLMLESEIIQRGYIPSPDLELLVGARSPADGGNHSKYKEDDGG